MSYSPVIEKIKFKGSLGPLMVSAGEQLDIEVRPFTVFIGPQGTGKSLVSQLLYFFRDAQSLLSGPDIQSRTGNAAVRAIVNGLRAGLLSGRDVANFSGDKAVRVEYNSPESKRSITINSAARYPITAIGSFKKEIDSLFESLKFDKTASRSIKRNAIFVPAARVVYSMFGNEGSSFWRLDALPLTFVEFQRNLEKAQSTYLSWQKDPSSKPEEAVEIEQMVEGALGGHLRIEQRGPMAGHLQWQPVNTQSPIEIELASTGQMETWPLILTAQTLFALPSDQRPKYLHVEEPEAHLHPKAQEALVQVLAYLVNKGIHVVITTHSLTILYAINNLTLAYQKMGKEKDAHQKNKWFSNLNPSVRLDPYQVSAYLFLESIPTATEMVLSKPEIETAEGAGGQRETTQISNVENLMYETDERMPNRQYLRQIDEGRLGEVLGNLQRQFNRLIDL